MRNVLPAIAAGGYAGKIEQRAQAGTVFVPFLFGNSVSAYDLYPLIRDAR